MIHSIITIQTLLMMKRRKIISKVVRASNWKWIDHSVDVTRRVYPSFGFKFPIDERSKHFALNASKYAEKGTVKKEEWDSFEREFTQELRRNSKRYGRILPMSRLRSLPMYCLADGLAAILPIDHKVAYDWITYRDPLWVKVITEIAEKCYKIAQGDPAAEKACGIMCVDYSKNAPYASCIRHDGRMFCGDSYPKEAIAAYRKALTKLFAREFKENPIEENCPSLNVTKSVGWPFQTPDGEPLDKEKFKFVPQKFFDPSGDDKTLQRYNYREFKESWVNSGALDKNLDYLLSNINDYATPSGFRRAFEFNAVSVHTEAYRGNNADELLNDCKGDFKSVLGKMYHKNRDFCYETEPYVWQSGKWDNRFLNLEMSRELNAPLLDNKKRPIFPSNTSSFGPPFIYLMRKLIHRMERSCVGFPANRPEWLEAWNSPPPGFNTSDCKLITFDRRTAEQFITDNFDVLLSLLPTGLGKVMRAFSTSVCASNLGPRVVRGLLSGAPPTTFYNMVFGLFEMVLCVIGVCTYQKRLSPDLLASYVTELMDGLIEERPYIKFLDCYVYLRLGTDDQICKIYGLKEVVPPQYCDERFISFESPDTTTVFGIYFHDGVAEVSRCLGLSKLFLMEKNVIGDAAAFKMNRRLMYLPDYYEAVASTFFDNGLGHISEYVKGEKAYNEEILASFGYAIDTSIYNEYSAVDQIIFGDLIKAESMNQSNKYPVEWVKRWDEKFKTFELFKE